MSREDLEGTVRALSNEFNIKPPKVVFVPNSIFLGYYVPAEDTIYLREDATPGVAAHEFSHYLLDQYGVNMSKNEEELFSQEFEEWFTHSGSFFKCEVCGNSVPNIKPYTRCFTCGAEYKTRIM